MYLVKSLPVQIHMSIAEALQKTVGKDYNLELIQFEKMKVEQLQNFSKQADPSCLGIMHNRM